MADTERTLTELLTNLFQDGQPPGSISEQDMRDFIVSVFSAYALTGGNPGYRVMKGSLTAAKEAGLNAPNFTQFANDGAGSAGVYAYAFDANTQEEIFVIYKIQHDYKEGTPFIPEVHWAPSDASAGVVRWGVEWIAARGSGQDTFGNTAFAYVEQATNSIAKESLTAHFAPIPVTNAEPDMTVLARVFRDAAHANDTYAADAFAFSLDTHYQTDHRATKNSEPPFYT